MKTADSHRCPEIVRFNKHCKRSDGSQQLNNQSCHQKRFKESDNTAHGIQIETVPYKVATFKIKFLVKGGHNPCPHGSDPQPANLDKQGN